LHSTDPIAKIKSWQPSSLWALVAEASIMAADHYSAGMEGLVEVVQRLSLARDLTTVQDIVRHAARHLTGADGATIVLRDGDRCYYADEDAIAPLWKGQRFPMSACISGWSMLNRRSAVIDDIYADDRIPHDAYRRTFVKSLVMVPIRTLDPIGAIGNYWAEQHHPTEAKVKLLSALADTTAVAMENVRVFTELEERVKSRTAELEETNRQLQAVNLELLAAHQQADRVFRAYARALPGTVLDGKYRLDEELGFGGFGVVFRGRHLVLDMPIAIKVFRPAPGNASAVGLQRFLREGAAASRLAHPNAVRIFDSGVSAEGVAFLTMELLHGRSLAAELAEVGRPSLRPSAMIAARVADVLAAAHRQGIIHRDIKPANVFLHCEGRGVRGEGRDDENQGPSSILSPHPSPLTPETVKVVDFGIAKFFGDEPAKSGERLTLTGELIGTPIFLAPERITGGADDGRSDVFALGALLYHMITGEMPWSSQDQLRMACGLDRKPPPLMADFRPNVPAELESLVRRALAMEATDRPTAQELAAELDRVAESLDESPASKLLSPQEKIKPTGRTSGATESGAVNEEQLAGSIR
jgi:serine/threonine protein kinase